MISEKNRQRIEDFFDGQKTVFATPNTDNHSANFYGDTHICRLTVDDVCSAVEVSDS